jgi:hypothetical protein
MTEIQPTIDLEETPTRIGLKINDHLNGLDRYKNEHKQKILELCQVGKFIGTYFNDFQITQVTERPDFIISNGTEWIGLEHEVIVNNKSKAHEGFYGGICEKVEINLYKDDSIQNCLVNLYLKDGLSFKIKDKADIIKELTEIVRNYILTGQLQENDIIERVHIMPHTQKNVVANFGAYVQETITRELVLSHIKKKEMKLASYKENKNLHMWLILVIGGLGQSSYKLRGSIDLNIQSNFDRVFLYEDFANKLYELK